MAELKNTTGAVKYKTITPVVNAPGGRGYSRNIVEGGKVVVVEAPATPSGPAAIIGRQYDITRPTVKPKKTTTPKDKQEIPASYTSSDVKFNLPPHKWSLPINVNTLSSATSSKQAIQHATRRARMWCFGPTDLAAMDTTVKTTTTDSTAQSFLLEHSSANKLSSFDTAWGFQFLWNPDKLNNTLSRNSNVTPNAADKTAQYYSLFTAMEAMTFNITIDRVNDFAAIKGWNNQYGMMSEAARESARDTFFQYAVDTYYAGNSFPSFPANPENPVDQLKTLMKLGTMADIEYIFKMINGEGMNGVTRKNALGRKTADIGFLSPTAIAVQFGPNSDSLSYVGWVEGISITHTMFTEDMIPIHSELTVSFVAFARTTLTQG